jgi:hypothetical protein
LHRQEAAAAAAGGGAGTCCAPLSAQRPLEPPLPSHNGGSGGFTGAQAAASKTQCAWEMATQGCFSCAAIQPSRRVCLISPCPLCF